MDSSILLFVIVLVAAVVYFIVKKKKSVDKPVVSAVSDSQFDSAPPYSVNRLTELLASRAVHGVCIVGVPSDKLEDVSDLHEFLIVLENEINECIHSLRNSGYKPYSVQLSDSGVSSFAFILY